jgi:hypothetical protein
MDETKKKTLSEHLIDSALIIAIFMGLCYAFGLFSQIRLASEYGIPLHLLPSFEFHDTIVFGSIYVLFYISVGLFIYMLYIYLNEHARWFAKIASYFQDRFFKYKIAFPLFIFVIASTIILLHIIYLADLLTFSHSRMIQMKNFPRVIELKLKDKSSPADMNAWHYISRKDNLIILGQLDKKRYMLINQENIERLVLERQME